LIYFPISKLNDCIDRLDNSVVKQPDIVWIERRTLTKTLGFVRKDSNPKHGLLVAACMEVGARPRPWHSRRGGAWNWWHCGATAFIYKIVVGISPTLFSLKKGGQGGVCVWR
jgi:hypothetical protein